MQIERDILNQPAKLADLLQTPLEKALIIRLKAQITLLTQDFVIYFQIRTPGQAALALTMKTVYDAITTNLEFYGSDSPHMDTYTMLAKLIKYLPEVAAEGGE